MAADDNRFQPSEPLSPDGHYWWDGTAWQDCALAIPPSARRSDDGWWWWDGDKWRPRPAALPPIDETYSPGLPEAVLVVWPERQSSRRRPDGMSRRYYWGSSLVWIAYTVANIIWRRWALVLLFLAMTFVSMAINVALSRKGRGRWCLFVTAGVIGKGGLWGPQLWRRDYIARLEVVRTYFYPRRVSYLRRWLVFIDGNDRAVGWTQIDGYTRENIEAIGTTTGLPLSIAWDEPITPSEFSRRFPRRLVGWRRGYSIVRWAFPSAPRK